MIKWIIIAGAALLFVGAVVLMVIVVKKKNKKKAQKLDENIKKLKSEKEELTIKEQKEEDKRKEEEAFANITLTDDNENEFADLFNLPTPEVKKEEPDFAVKKQTKQSDFDDLFLNDFDKKKATPKKKSRDEEFDEFLNEHSFTRRVFDGELLQQIKNLPPKIKAIVLGNVFNKFED
ncbi:MAG: hypothetical protein IJY90_00490 [Clostridia bacterium]|nr:hypothetical protein [Clostridia bacterium]